MFLKLVDKVDIDEILDEFENWLDWIINLKSHVPLIAEKPLFDIVTGISYKVLIGSS